MEQSQPTSISWKEHHASALGGSCKEVGLRNGLTLQYSPHHNSFF